MGRMKDLYYELLQANNGEIPQEATIADLARMNDLKMPVPFFQHPKYFLF